MKSKRLILKNKSIIEINKRLKDLNILRNSLIIVYQEHTLDVGNIETEIGELNRQWRVENDNANDAIQFNENASITNAKRDALIDQKNDFTVRQKTIKSDILSKSNQINSLNILKKAFSTSGIVAFKLENLTKELEIAINKYLSTLSDGQFQVEFKLDKEKAKYFSN